MMGRTSADICSLDDMSSISLFIKNMYSLPIQIIRIQLMGWASAVFEPKSYNYQLNKEGKSPRLF